MSEKERPVRTLRFSGFGLGIWPWPLINILFEMRGRSAGLAVRGRSSLTPTMANEEKWTWTDYKGQKRELVIHREVRE